jgi:hypothetical protein
MVRDSRSVHRTACYVAHWASALGLACSGCSSSALAPRSTASPGNDAGASSPNTDPASIWSTSPTGDDTTCTDGRSVELGVKFKSTTPGQVIGVRFYKGAGNGGTHTATLWDASTRQRLSDTVPFENETTAGWQSVLFPVPVDIAAERTYVASYHAPNGHYAFTAGGLDNATNAPPLQSIAGTIDPNGVFSLGATSQFPDQCFGNANYWVDVLFAAGATFTIWPPSATPAAAAVTDDRSLELGVKFRSDIDGRVTGVRYYKGPTNTDTHTATLWTDSRSILATSTFSNETADGWQTAKFTEPVGIVAGRTYVASYHTLHGHYAFDQGALADGQDAGPLHALPGITSGGNGVYALDGDPSWASFNDSNYWVDVIFVP